MTPPRGRRAALTVTQLEDRLVPVGGLSEQIIVDQIGWRSDAAKVVVFADPQQGQNAAVTYVPGSSFQVRRVSDDAVVFTGGVAQWNGGATHVASGDRAWHGDFSAVTAPGEYYVYDPTNNLRSFAFRVQADVYNDVLKTAGRVFFYQRSGFDKTPQYAGNWSHAASHLQERTARRIVGSTPQGAATARDVSGGWWDAGDYNKYVPFTTNVIWDLLSAYEWNPAAFSDAWNIPESGNGRADILDEVKWELDWLLKMQLADGGVINRVGQTSYDVGSGPTADTQPHYYTGATTWATASFAASTAHAATVFAAIDSAYSATLRTAAERAWQYLTANSSMNPSNGQDGGTLAAADAGGNTGMDRRLRVLAAAELWRLTGTAAYKTYFESNYKQSALAENGYHPLINNAFDTSLATDLNRALVTYARTAGASTTIVNEIKAALRNSLDWYILPNRTADPYMGFMWDGHYTWGSNQLKAAWANVLTYARVLNVGTAAERATFRQIAEEYLHYFHGRNPLSMTYLTNTGTKGGTGLGADKSPMEAYHGWWPDGSSLYDGADSTYGPAPGYVVGGPNQYFTRPWVSPPAGMPAMKAFRDWNAVWNAARQDTENSWEITEPAIYYQAPYVLLVSQYATAATPPPPRSVSVAVNGTATPSPGLTVSRLTSLRLTFDTPVATLDPGAFTLTRGATTLASGGAVAVSGLGTTTLTLTFTAAAGVESGSLADGVWTLYTDLSKVRNAAGTAGTGTLAAGNVRRLFGDGDGDGAVTLTDFGLFGGTFGRGSASPGFRAAFDANGDGTIDLTDFAAFGQRFGKGL